MTTNGTVKGHGNHHQQSSAATYERVREIMSQPPDRRMDFEINSILPWFRNMKDSKVLGQLKPSILIDVLKNVQFLSKRRDELIIRQGDEADCMYVILRGQVTIYHNYGVTSDGTGEDGDAAVARSVATVTGEALRQQLGAFVVTLKEPGTPFGEVALLSDNGRRTASVIADEPSTDLIVIDRALYNRSVQQVIKREFDQKSKFILQHPHFRMWQGKYIKQLTMALEKEIYSYEHVITKQAAPVDAIYFIISGEAKLVMDPQMHYTQFPKLLVPDSRNTLLPSNPNIPDALRSYSDRAIEDSPRTVVRRLSKRQQPVEVCLLGVNEAVGDIETLMGLSTYMQTSICTQTCELLVLDMKHFDRLFVRRNPRTITLMKAELELRIRSRIASSYLPKTVPLLDKLIQKAAECSPVNKATRKNSEDNTSNARRSQSNKCGGNADGIFIPTQGALLDQYGPGTVFYRIRQNREKNARQSVSRGSVTQRQTINGLTEVKGGATADHPPINDGRPVIAQNGIEHRGISVADVNSSGGLTTVDVDLVAGIPMTSTLQSSIASTSIQFGNGRASSMLERSRIQQQQQQLLEQNNDVAMSADDTEAIDELENRLREWLTEDGFNQRVAENGTAAQRQQQQLQLAQQGSMRPRVSRLHRASTEFDQVKPGVKIVMRRKRIVVTPFPVSRESSGDARGKQLSESELKYYRTALTDPVPLFQPPARVSR